MSYKIDSNKCSACANCMDVCPMEAIASNDGGKYLIDPEICTDCGSCADICPEEAIRGS
jgi:MinD superfamily P-loop ATPase